MFREVAKFFAGVTAWEALTHASFAVGGVLPFKICGVNVTRRLNAIQIVVPGIASLALIYVGWGRTPTRFGR